MIPPAAAQTIRSAVLDAHQLRPAAPEAIARHVLRALADAGWQITPIPPTDHDDQEISPMPKKPDPAAAARAELAGHDLACRCALSQLCHADVLLELANQPAQEA
ncbi:DUF4326 domain-containing protein [Kitasatospora sp. NPDC091276]|uniref:DUF4326 domain-containing protein n=1 Tax=unclassified Kitasatospora TaxID=2633591 RepID=UPI00343CF18D